MRLPARDRQRGAQYASAVPHPCLFPRGRGEKCFAPKTEGKRTVSYFLRFGGERRSDCRRQPVPTGGFVLEAFAASDGELIKLGAAIIVRCAPVRFEQSLLAQTEQRRIERSLLHQQRSARDLANAQQDSVAV